MGAEEERVVEVMVVFSVMPGLVPGIHVFTA
jgi:hypothetical protein